MFALKIKASFLLSTHVGVQVEETDHSTRIYETKYCEEIIQRYNPGNAHWSRILMETNTRLTGEDTDVDHIKSFSARWYTLLHVLDLILHYQLSSQAALRAESHSEAHQWCHKGTQTPDVHKKSR